ncbi:chitinase-like protein Idgf3 [Lucilia sericata]|uniref:chitinase-like protein Idgf3 n=1 Tax=Lucilia sericata TaxID=13632 RepID=UPI0018A86D7A|nr:chitinase-like protein Idgf3 [Lucilia sericata]
MAWKSTKKLFTGDFVVDKQADEHKQQLTELVKKLKTSFAENDLLLSLTVLPNVNSSWYFNVPALINQVDFVNLAAFDFTTPERNPYEADYTAPLYAPTLEGNRLSHYNVDYQVEHWTSQRFPKTKINVGIATYGRAWKMTLDSKSEGYPIIPSTDGAAEAGPQTKVSGLLSWPEICLKLQPKAQYSLRRFADPTKKHGTYAFRAADENGEHGTWVSYDDPEVAATKAAYVMSKGLGGVALFDLTLNDFRGQCTGDQFPILRAIKYKL